jgi:hypothetical protein
MMPWNGYSRTGLMSVMHGESSECSGMFTNTFVVSHKEIGAMQSLALLFAASALLIMGSVSLLWLLVSQQRFIHILLRARSKLAQLHGHLLQQFSSGILHPQTY